MKDLLPVYPKINNQVKVIAGEFKGEEGILINTEGEEGIVKLYNKKNETVAMIQRKYLCLMAE